jgi:protein-tyrosine phosphatase
VSGEGGIVVRTIPKGPRMTEQSDARTIEFERWWNVRDLGGLPTVDGAATRLGVLVRAASPQFATPGDIAGARRRGLMSFVDLRLPNHAPDWRAEAGDATTVDVNLAASVRSPREEIDPHQLLRLLLDEGRAELTDAIRHITRMAEESPPVVFHCHTGKDRTGLVAILFLSLAGVPDEVIVEDYLASNPGFEAMRSALSVDGNTDVMPGAPPALRGPVSRPAAEEALRFLEELGGTAAYLEWGGLSSQEIDRAASLLR